MTRAAWIAFAAFTFAMASSPPAAAQKKTGAKNAPIEAQPAEEGEEPELPPLVVLPEKAPEPAEAPKPAAPAPAPAAPAPAPAPSPAAPAPRLELVPTAGFGWVVQPGQPEALAFRVGANAAWRVTPEFAVELQLRDHFYRIGYRTLRPSPFGGLGAVELQEQKIDLDLYASYDALRLVERLFLKDKPIDRRFSAAVFAGPSSRFLYNGALDAATLALAVGARGGLAITESLDVSAGAGYGFNFLFPLDDAHLSLAGGAYSVTTYGAALGLVFPPHSRLRIGYEGELFALRRDFRFYHTVSLTFDLRL
jgi:hypothetical protein